MSAAQMEATSERRFRSRELLGRKNGNSVEKGWN